MSISFEMNPTLPDTVSELMNLKRALGPKIKIGIRLKNGEPREAPFEGTF